MKKLLLGCLISIAFSQTIVAQQDLPGHIQGYFESYQQESPPEKAYLMLDKETYTLGEDLWFSSFLVVGSTQILSPLSKTLYVDFFDGEGQLIEQKIIKISEGRGKGDFRIPEYGKPGEYRIKAYTAWMKNFGKDYFFEKTINVVDGQGGDFLPSLSISKVEKLGNTVRYQSQLQAITKNGQAVPAQKVEIRVLGEGEELLNQSLELNPEGKVDFSFEIPEKAFQSLGLEITHFENGDYPVVNNLKLPFSLSLADIKFLPEGGNWLLNKKSILAFRAVAPDGSPLKIEGKVAGEDINFASNFAGLGKFEFTPSQTQNSVSVKDLNTGQQLTFDLPEAKTEGLSLTVVDNSQADYLTVFAQGAGVQDSLLLVSQTRGLINYMIKGGLVNGVWGSRIPRETLIPGINQITILTLDGRPLVERLLFIQPQIEENAWKIEQSGALTSRSNVKIDMAYTSDLTENIGSYAISILDADQLFTDEDKGDNIYSYLLMSSDLKGKVHNPAYYFTDPAATKEELDLVMLTHGWRRFTWEDILTNKQVEIAHFIEQGISIEGQITEQTQSNRGLKGGKISALVNSTQEFIGSEFGPNGRFLIRDLEFDGKDQITFTAEDERKANFIDVELVQPEATFSELYPSYWSQIIWPEKLAESLQVRRMMQQMTDDPDLVDLEEFTVEGQNIQQEEDRIKKVYGSGDASIDPDKIPGSAAFNNILQMLQGRVAGVQVFLSGMGADVQIRGVGSATAGTSPLFLLDNIPVDINVLLQINPRDVASLDVFKDPASTSIFGSQGANGVIAVYTKTGAGIQRSVGGTLVTDYQGYAVAREFYQPDYSEKTTENAISDQRATIYWNPLVELKDSEVFSIEYYNTDVAENHLLIIEGIDSNGNLRHLTRLLK